MGIKTRVTSQGIVSEAIEGEGSTFTIEIPSSFASSFSTAQEYVSIGSGSATIETSYANKILEIDPAGSTTTLNFPETMQRGFYCMIRLIGSGSVTMQATGSATMNSTAGSSPTISTQWGHATADKRSTTGWVISGDIS